MSSEERRSSGGPAHELLRTHSCCLGPRHCQSNRLLPAVYATPMSAHPSTTLVVHAAKDIFSIFTQQRKRDTLSGCIP